MFLKIGYLLEKYMFCGISGKYWQVLGRIKDYEEPEDEYNNYISDIIVMMKQSEMESLHNSVNAQANIVKEYVTCQEDLLIAYSKSYVIVELLKNPSDKQKQTAAQEYTEKYYTDLEDW